MLSYNTIMSVTSSVSVDDERKFKLRHGSLLKDTVDSTTGIDYVHDEAGNEDIAHTLSTLNKPTDNTVVHTLSFDKVVSALSGIVSNSVHLIKGTIAPIVNETTDEVIHDLMAYQKSIVNEDYQISTGTIPDLLISYPSLVNKDHYDGMTKRKFVCDEINDINLDIESLLLTGVDEYDALIHSMFSVYPELSTKVVDTFFMGTSSESIDNAIADYNVFDRLELCLAGYLALLTIEEETVGTNNLIVYLAVIMSKDIELIHTWLRTKKVIIGTPSKDGILVLSDTYKELLQAGGSSDMVIGAVIAGNDAYLQDILDSGVEYIKQYKEYTTSMFIAAEHMTFGALRNIAYSVISSSIGTSEVEKKHMLTNPGFVAKANDLLQEELDNMDENTIVDIGRYVNDLVSGCRFYFTNAKLFLNYMDAISKRSPEMSVESVEWAARIELMAEYLANDIIVE